MPEFHFCLMGKLEEHAYANMHTRGSADCHDAIFIVRSTGKMRGFAIGSLFSQSSLTAPFVTTIPQ